MMAKDSFWQSHDCNGYRAKVTIEWEWPDGEVASQGWLNRAEEIAEEAFSKSGPSVRLIVLAMQGRDSTQEG